MKGMVDGSAFPLSSMVVSFYDRERSFVKFLKKNRE